MTSFGRGLRALVVDDEEVVRMVVSELLESADFDVSSVGTLTDAMEAWSPESFDLAMIDKNLPDGTGLDLAKRIADAPGDHATMIMTGYSSIDSAVEAIRLDVAAYLVKPFGTLEDVLAQVERAVSVMKLRRDNRTLVAELRDKTEILEGLVVRDPVTQLFNHQFLHESLERELVRSNRHGHPMSLILLDVDGFADFNERHGHSAGDHLLRTLAADLVESSRASDLGFRANLDDVIARFDADVFALVLPETAKPGAAAKAEKLRAFVEQSEQHPVTVSLGVAAAPTDATERVQLVEAASAALKAAKQGGRNRVVAFSPSLTNAAAKPEQGEEIERLIALDRSIENGSFRHVYQPIVKAGSAEVVAYECLCRPTDPGFSNPFQLFQTGVSAGRVQALGRAVRVGCGRPLARWPAEQTLFVNLHPLEVSDDLFEDEPEMLGLASRIVLEVTESAEIRDFKGFRRRLDRLRERGFRIAVDDLGAGYAGLNSLAKLAPDFVKLDMGLVRGVQGDRRSARLVKHIVEYANDEGIITIAEGIETAEERAAIEGLECPLMQGYFFGKPAPFEPEGA